MSKSIDPSIQKIAASYNEDEIRMLSKDWLQLKDFPRFLAKQLSHWASNHSTEHRFILKMINFIKKNCFRWMPFL